MSQTVDLQGVLYIASVAVGFVFAYATVLKLKDPASFVDSLRRQQIVPDSVAPFAAISLIIVEGAVAVAHIGVLGLQYFVPLTISLIASFLAVTVVWLARGESRPCLCFGGGGDDSVDIGSAIRLSLLLLSEVILYRQLAINNWSLTADLGNILLIAAAGLVAALFGWCFTLSKLYRAWRVVRS